MQHIVNVLLAIILILSGILSYYYFYLRTRDYINPFGISIAIWSLISGISSLHLSYLQKKWDFDTYLMIIIFPIAIFISGYIMCRTKRKNRLQRDMKFTNAYILCSRAIFCVCMICAFIEWKNDGFAVLLRFSMASENDMKSMLDSVRYIHYGTVLLPYCTIASVYEWVNRENIHRITYLYLIVSILIPILHCLFVQISRGTLIIIVLGVLYILNDVGVIRIKVIAIGSILMLAAFILISLARISSQSLVYKVIPGHPLISAVYGYTGLNFENLNLLAEHGPSYSIAKRTFWGVWQLIGLDKLLTPLRDTFQTKFFNAIPIVYVFYDDLGLFGVLLYTFVFFSLIGFVYFKSKQDKRFVLLIAALQKAIWMNFFGNYFFAYRIIAFPYIAIMLLILSMRLRLKCKG